MDADRLRELADVPDPRLTGANTGIYFNTNTPDVTEVLWIRHGHIPESGPNDDPHLTAIGLEQAEALGQYLTSQKPLTAIYCSPFLRCRETASAIASRQALEVEIRDELREVEVYVPEGLTMRQHLGAKPGRLRRRMRACVPGMRAPGSAKRQPQYASAPWQLSKRLCEAIQADASRW
jgi:broad specificity phosphatase PhoE